MFPGAKQRKLDCTENILKRPLSVFPRTRLELVCVAAETKVLEVSFVERQEKIEPSSQAPVRFLRCERNIYVGALCLKSSNRTEVSRQD